MKSSAQDIANEVYAAGKRAKSASRELALIDSDSKNRVLDAWSKSLADQRHSILNANSVDLESARSNGISEALLDRLELNPQRLEDMISGLQSLINLPDPVGEVLAEWSRPNGLQFKKVRVPIGVIAIIYESRPNVTVDAAGLCFKSSNAVILRGGTEAHQTNLALVKALTNGGRSASAPENSVQLIESTSREAVTELVKLEGLVDLVIPRGGEGLIRAVAQESRVPVLKHYKGVCHLFVDESADPEMALKICENAKCQRPGVCNALETLLIHSAVAPAILPRLAEMAEARNLELRGDERVRSIIPAGNATEDDWHAEYLALILAVKIVDDIDGAVEHIAAYGSGHTDAIVTESDAAAEYFTRRVDAGLVLVNASTRFNDGGQFGFGAEMGISTDKFHARGPVGLQELTTYKYVASGKGHVRE